MQVFNEFWLAVFIFRFFWGSGQSDNGACWEVNNDTVAQMGFLPWQLWRWTEGPGFTTENTVTFAFTVLNYTEIYFQTLNESDSHLCSSLNWVTPQMLDVPFPDKKTAITGDPFLPAITGELLRLRFYINIQVLTMK